MKAVVAMTRSRVIGKNNQIPWRLAGEQKWFKEITMGHSVLMGRKTFESIGRPLPGRRNIVVTRSGEIEGVEIVRDLENFDPRYYEESGKELFVIGGSEIYRALLPGCDQIFVTMVRQEYEGDTYFPEFEEAFEPERVIRDLSEYTVLLYRRIRRAENLGKPGSA
jgi:dihydrofolate reductase